MTNPIKAQIYCESDIEGRINAFDDFDMGHNILLSLFNDPNEWVSIHPNFRNLAILEWLKDTGYAHVVVDIYVAQISALGVQYLDKITSVGLLR